MNKRRKSVPTNEPAANTSADAYAARLWAVPILIVIIDQLTKIIIPALGVRTVHNTGTIFGLFPNQNAVITVLSLAIIIGIIYVSFLRNEPESKQERMTQLVAMIIIGGGIANTLDRLRLGYVVDFIHLPFWPSFNLADVCISVGVTFLLFKALILDKES